MFERALADVDRRLSAAGLSRIMHTVTRIRVVSEESFHDSRNNSIGLNPADVRKPYAAFHNRRYLIVHELGHHFAEQFLGRADQRAGAAGHAGTAGRRARLQALRGVFGDYDAPYRRLPKPRSADADHVSRYAMTHPAEDFAETFAVTLWRLWDRPGVEALLRGKSACCRAKVRVMQRLLRSSLGPSLKPSPRPSLRSSGSGRAPRRA